MASNRKTSGPRIASEGSANRQTQDGKKSLRLSVASFTKRKSRSTEKSFEKSFYAALTEFGLPNWHMACRDKGWPDRLAKGGRWFELKSLASLGNESQLSPGQKIKMDMLTKAGDQCWYVAKWENSVIFVEYGRFKELDHSPARAVADGHRFAYMNKADLKEIFKWKLVNHSS